MRPIHRLPMCAAMLSVAMLGATLRTAFLTAQEPEPRPAAGGRGGRGGRGGGGGRGSTREFLGLGAAPDPQAAKAGEPLYKQNCGGCHGETARGAQGPNL